MGMIIFDVTERPVLSKRKGFKNSDIAEILPKRTKTKMSKEDRAKMFANEFFPIGTKIHIDYMDGEPQYEGKEGIVEHIDGIGQIHGSWGGCALIPFVDRFHKI